MCAIVQCAELPDALAGAFLQAVSQTRIQDWGGVEWAE